ncbi:unnamed protein product [Phytophthora fragariaefolia]|uniref:Unnamed protein product n=1 Tax=Phytophthora fragariaefolia TaxID=1490495 RepID=A0A9W7D6E5_9STRA|nr:unnamed protein product [Phytophthora fragariaefolia]
MVRVTAGSVAIVAALNTVAAHSPAYVYKFDAANAGGVDGTIQTKYTDEDSSVATITAALDFSGVDLASLAAFDGNCSEAVTSYKWHIHTKWNSTLSSDSFKQCSKAATDNHYDPLRACGSASEYIDEADCKAKSLTYACNPSNYTANPLVCEKGDLSGKFGAFSLGEDAAVSGQWTDEHFPLPSETSHTWSIVLHAVCGTQTPRIACAVVQAEGEDDYDEGSASEHEGGSEDGHADEQQEGSEDGYTEEQQEEENEEQTAEQGDNYGEGHEHGQKGKDEHKLCASPAIPSRPGLGCSLKLLPNKANGIQLSGLF